MGLMRAAMYVVGIFFMFVRASLGSNHLYRAETFTSRGKGNGQECAKYEEDRLFLEGIDMGKYGWHRNALRRHDRTVLYGTAFAQRLIWAHQNPAQCDGAKYVTLKDGFMGMGANLHHLARVLGIGMQTGRILASVPDEKFLWYDKSACDATWQCWVNPFTSCFINGAVEFFLPEKLQREGGGNFTSSYVPSVFHDMLRSCSRIKRSMWYYWWHAQVTTYVLRFNKETRQLLDELRQNRLLRVDPHFRGPRRVTALPRGTVAMHVRHADKYLEMPLIEFDAYVAEAQRLSSGDQNIRVLNPEFSETDRTYAFDPEQFRNRVMLVNADMHEVMSDAIVLSRRADNPWSVVYMLQNRSRAKDVGKYWILHMAREWKGGRLATLESLLGLELALEADAWICTLYSNWCQVIDGLRMTVGGKAASPYVNLIHHNFYDRREDWQQFRPYHRRCYTIL
mmetsp:Transcript_41804/g.115205  ORF Transcript_41804/g.115205 Transcript_41804/m.115205 type:complete len:452 (-) Transcript_41804:217-1572(-)